MTGDEEGEEEGGLTQRTEGEEGEDEGGLENKRKKRSGQQNSPASASKLPSPTKEAKRHRSTDDSDAKSNRSNKKQKKKEKKEKHTELAVKLKTCEDLQAQVDGGDSDTDAGCDSEGDENITKVTTIVNIRSTPQRQINKRTSSPSAETDDDEPYGEQQSDSEGDGDTQKQYSEDEEEAKEEGEEEDEEEEEEEEEEGNVGGQVGAVIRALACWVLGEGRDAAPSAPRQPWPPPTGGKSCSERSARRERKASASAFCCQTSIRCS